MQLIKLLLFPKGVLRHYSKILVVINIFKRKWQVYLIFYIEKFKKFIVYTINRYRFSVIKKYNSEKLYFVALNSIET